MYDISIGLESRIFTEYHAGKNSTRCQKYEYSLEYNPLALMHTWIVYRPLTGGPWEFLKPLSSNLQFTPRNSVRGCNG